MMAWVRTHRTAIAFVVLALAIAWVVQTGNARSADRLYNNAIAACQRGNALRTESNERAPIHEKALVIERRFLLTAAEARTRAYERDGAPEDRKAAQSYREQAGELDGLTFTVVPLVDCKATVKHP